MRKTIAVLIALVFGLTACAAGESSQEMVAGDGDAALYGNGSATAEEPSDGAPALDVGLDVVEGRQVIRHANLQLHAGDTRAAYDDIVALVRSAGGFLASAQVYPTSGEDDQPQITMTVRVPAAELDSTMAAIKGSVDEVVSETQGAEDVTADYIDLEARLTNLRALEVELRALLQEVRMQPNADPEKLLRVFDEVSSVRGEIEQIQGQLDYLSDLTELATLEIGLTQSPAAAPIVDEPWAPGETAKDALRSLVTGLQRAADAAIGFGLYVLPMMLLVLGPLALIGWFAYRRIARRPSTGAAG